jgi:hypothetical protein
MNSSIYVDNLINNLLRHKENVIKQQGKSDIEPEDYLERTENWYQSMISLINQNPPTYYVKSLDIKLDEDKLIGSIEYGYCEGNISSDYVYINIYN